MAPTSKKALSRPRHGRLIAAVALSRVLILAAGVLGETQLGRISGWHIWDWQQLTERLGPVGNAIAGATVRWDAVHYIDISVYGYRSRVETGFFPLYPALIKLVAFPFSSHVWAAVAISAVSFAIALTLLHRLTGRLLNGHAADAAVLLLAFAPLSLFFTAAYSESLFLALALGALTLALGRHWWLACVLVAAATLTRVPGVLLTVPVAIMMLRQHGRRRRLDVFALLLPPLSLAGFCAYLAYRGYGWLSPIRTQVVDHQHSLSLSGPLATIPNGVRDGVRGLTGLFHGAPLLAPNGYSTFGTGFTNTIELVMLLIAVVTLLMAARRLPPAFSVYSLLALLLCVWSPQSLIPMDSLDRYLLVIFPLWMVAADWLARHRLLWPVLGLSTVLMCLYAAEFARWAFVA